MSESENKDLLEALNSVKPVKVGDVVKGEVLAFDDKKQVIVGIEGTGVEGVVPARELSVKADEIEDNIKVGDVLDLVVISKIGSDKEGGSYLLSQRRLEARKVWDEIEKKFEAGETLTVPVTQIVKGVGKPSDVLKVGEDVKVKVLAVDPEKDRISLSIKQTLPQPWDDIEEKVAEGDVLDGKVKRLTSFGAFVEVFPGVEGLVHISQISHKHIATPNEVLTSGQDVKVKVLNVNGEDRRLALSIKALQEKPAF